MLSAFLVCSIGLLSVVCGAPNIVVIIADDMGWNDVSYHGSSQIMTPNIDALAYQGVILNRHYALPSCSPSRSAFLTGMYPIHTGMQKPIGAGTTSALSLNFTILPQHLGRLGYRTHLVGKWHLGSHRSEYLPTKRGFQSHFGFWNGFLGYFDGIHLASDGIAGLDARRNMTEAWQEFVGHYSTDLFTQEAVTVIQDHNISEGPLYLQVALSAPHTGNRGSELQVRDLLINEQQHADIVDLHRRLYAGMVRGVDDSVGAILEAMHSSDLLNNSIVLFISDNGAPTLDPIWSYNNSGSNWPLRGMKLSCHEGGVRTTAAFYSPLVVGGQVSEQLIHITDWLPTFYSAAGGNVKDLGMLDGVNQWESLTSQNETGERKEMLVDLDPISGNEAFIHWPWKLIRYSHDFPEMNTYAGESGWSTNYSVDQVVDSLAAQLLSMSLTDTEILAIRANATIDNRCYQVVNNKTNARPCVEKYCLFNLFSDPCEGTDLSNDYPTIVLSLKQDLDRYMQSSVPCTPIEVDPRSHPSHWHNYWVPWADQTSGAERLRTITSLAVIFVYIIIY